MLSVDVGIYRAGGHVTPSKGSCIATKNNKRQDSRATVWKSTVYISSLHRVAQESRRNSLAGGCKQGTETDTYLPYSIQCSRETSTCAEKLWSEMIVYKRVGSGVIVGGNSRNTVQP